MEKRENTRIFTRQRAANNWQQPSQHAVIGPRADIIGWQAAVLGTRLLITARFPAADAALALAGGDLSVLGPREARALISDARHIPMIYYLF